MRILYPPNGADSATPEYSTTDEERWRRSALLTANHARKAFSNVCPSLPWSRLPVAGFVCGSSSALQPLVKALAEHLREVPEMPIDVSTMACGMRTCTIRVFTRGRSRRCRFRHHGQQSDTVHRGVFPIRGHREVRRLAPRQPYETERRANASTCQMADAIQLPRQSGSRGLSGRRAFPERFPP